MQPPRDLLSFPPASTVPPKPAEYINLARGRVTAVGMPALRDDADIAAPESLFERAWWLEAAAGEDLEQVSVAWGGRVVARMAFIRQKSWGFTILSMPPFTRTLGPFLQLPASNKARQMRNLHKAIQELVRSLPQHDKFMCTLDPQSQAAFPLALAGCAVGQNYTFRSDAVSSMEDKWRELDPKTRNLIRTASKQMVITPDGSIEDVIDLSRQQRKGVYQNDDTALRRIALAASARSQSVTLVARDPSGRRVGAATLVWDDAVLYYWQAARDVNSAITGCNNLLVWESLRIANTAGRVFDIDGFHSEGSARFTASFGFDLTVRPAVLHMSQRGRFVQAVGRLMGRGQNLGVPSL